MNSFSLFSSLCVLMKSLISLNCISFPSPLKGGCLSLGLLWIRISRNERGKKAQRDTLTRDRPPNTQWLIMHLDLVVATSSPGGGRAQLGGSALGCGLVPGCEGVQVCPTCAWPGACMEWGENSPGCVLMWDHQRNEVIMPKPTGKFKACAPVIPVSILLAKASHVAQANISGAGSLLPHNRGKGVTVFWTNDHNEEFQEISGRGCSTVWCKETGRKEKWSRDMLDMGEILQIRILLISQSLWSGTCKLPFVCLDWALSNGTCPRDWECVMARLVPHSGNNYLQSFSSLHVLELSSIFWWFCFFFSH